MAGIAAQICHVNGLSISDGGPITIVAARIEDVESLPVDKVIQRSLQTMLSAILAGLIFLKKSQTGVASPGVMRVKEKYLTVIGTTRSLFCKNEIRGCKQSACPLAFELRLIKLSNEMNDCSPAR